jgi:hypothetical protein
VPLSVLEDPAGLGRVPEDPVRCPPPRFIAQSPMPPEVVYAQVYRLLASARSDQATAIGGPLTQVSQGPSRSLAVHRIPRSGRSGTRICRIPKLIVRVRFPSPALSTVTRSSINPRSAAPRRISRSLSKVGKNQRMSLTSIGLISYPPSRPETPGLRQRGRDRV